MKEWNEKLLEEIEINTLHLASAVVEKSGHIVFEDSYGNGVALINNTSYATWHDVAEAFGLDITDFQA
ncbi:DUF2525 domain-containing protein [Desulfuromonas acetoxidans]|uniref:DUF2525 domain-containing protein n=1 Tax=Desulfuromonas acetoxidans TaxID=891 RepID=UPI0029303552|nr:DUF2525 domain-containing protein [Desulfuromonas acetoxidans]